jgi:hypothetical protein
MHPREGEESALRSVETAFSKSAFPLKLAEATMLTTLKRKLQEKTRKWTYRMIEGNTTAVQVSVKSKTREGRLRTGEIFKACEGSARNSLFFHDNQMDFARLSSLFDSSLEVAA